MAQQLEQSKRPQGAQRILEVASRLFADHGVDGISIAQIAREAGVGKATIFHHFPSKDALYQAVLWQVAERAIWLVEDQSWRDGTLVDCMRGFIRQQIAQLEEGDELLRLVRRELLQAGPDAAALMSDIFSRPFQRLQAHLEERVRTGELSSEVDTALLAWMLMDSGVRFHEGKVVLPLITGLEVLRDPDVFSHRMAELLSRGCLCAPGSGPTAAGVPLSPASQKDQQ
ncbi:TetR/AcrR family transcriptional regulator [Natronospira bacteriovora]|uniref:Helix-turn-helix domain-containing protein n=1 Tax=Natronospira bacteriovora TaxID=3069753 RepID=A0ABU0W6B3_9GAMM|nr:TetR/AcrR family transcriptional regulator [Natronospira sp. AB-CW4]MDQ2068535.1 helix-turn-helix domain-containing protein [Natronospira sp. AB-CW4]